MYTTRFPDIQFARPGLQRVLQIDADKFQTVYNRIYKERQTKFAFERFGGISVFPYAPEVAEGAPVPNAVMKKIGFRDYYVKQYGFAVQITAQGRWTDVYNLFDLQFQKLHLGQSMKRTEEKVHALFLENAFSAASDGSNLTIDGTAPFVHNHPLADGSTFSNRGDGAADLTLSISALETATIRLARQPLYEKVPNPASGKYILVIPPELAPLAHRLTQSPYQPATAAGDIRNDVSYVYGRFTMIENPYLDDTNNWYLFDADESRREWYCLRRLPLSVKLDEDIRAGTYIAVVREEFNPFVLDWRGSWGTAP